MGRLTNVMCVALIVVALLFAVCLPACAQGSIDEKWVRVYNTLRGSYQTLDRGALMTVVKMPYSASLNRLQANASLDAYGINDRKMYWFEDFLGYSNAATGVAVLATTTAPAHTSVLTPADYYWGSAGTSGTVKLIAGVNGTAVLDTGNAAQNDDAILTWREANFDITNNPCLEVLVKPNNLTNCIFEAGWYVDANDEILFRFNPAVSTTKWQLYYENNNGGEQVFDTGVAASTSAYTRLRIDLLSTGGAKCYINDVLVKAYPASTVRDVAFKPRFYAKVTDAGHAAAKTLTVDYVKLWQDR